METTKPKVKLTGQDGNIFNLVAISSKALKRSGNSDKSKEMTDRVFGSGSYEEAISIISEYCEVS